jgi:hypothetical protein
MISLGFSKFARERHKKGTGNSFFNLSEELVIKLVTDEWALRYPGQGETGLDRKIVVPVNPIGFWISTTTTLLEGMPLQAEVVRRQPGEDPYVEVYIDTLDAMKFGISPTPAVYCNIVCYSAEALLENGGERSTFCDWEIVAILASKKEIEPMPPLTMARNFLEKAGGTKSIYSAEEFAQAIYDNSIKGVKIKDKGIL